MRAVALLSGGMDSTTLAYKVRAEADELHLLSFDYGQRHGRRELSHAYSTAQNIGADSYRVVDLSSLRTLLEGSALTDKDVEVPDGHYSEESMAATVVPNRNAIMLSVAVGVAVARKADVVVCAIHAGDHAVYPDCRPEFISAFDEQAVIATEGFHVEGFQVLAPFVHITKADICKLGDTLGVPWEDTWSCYKGGNLHCGRCGTCVERAEAFHLAGVSDPTRYQDAAYWKTVTA